MNNRPLRLLLVLLATMVSGCVAQKKIITAEVDINSKRSLSNYLFGYNTQLMRGPSWDDKGFVKAVKDLQPQNLRFPGGTNANYWNWKTGWIKTDTSVRKEWQSLKPVSYTLDHLKKASDETGAAPVFVLNMLTSTLAGQLEMLHAAKKLGITVKLVELGNEFYLEDKDNRSVFATAADYAQMANEYIAAIRKDFSGVKIAVAGNSLRDGQWNDSRLSQRFMQWNDIVFKNVKDADAVTFHVYGGSGLEMVPTKEPKAKHSQRSEYTEKEKQVYQSAFDDNSSLSKVLGIPYVRNHMVVKNDLPAVPAGWKVWVTEYNMFENEGVVAGTWAHGLYAASQALLLMDIQPVELICYHDIAHGAQFGAIFNSDNGFNGFFKSKTTQSNAYSASGHSLKLIGEALKGKDEMYSLKFSDAVMTPFVKNKNYPALTGFKFSNKEKAGYILLNLSPGKLMVSISKLDGNVSTFKQVSGDPRVQVAKDSDLLIKTGNIKVDIELPAYSITRLE